ncbi:MAG: FRG domain-containing protein [Phycisphaerales bacterium]
MSTEENFWDEKEIKNWSDVKELEEVLFPPRRDSEKTDQQNSKKPKKKWVFRAEKVDQELKTNLEEKFDLNGVTDGDEKRKEERGIIRRFQRKAALYLEREPDKDDILEWLAIMRHHEAPTRLLDWTYSFYIAVYFALAKNKEGVVWALDASTINTPKPIKEKIKNRESYQRYEYLEKYFQEKSDILGIRKEGDKLIDLAIASYLIEHQFPCVYPVNPFRSNKRLSVQQGLFLMPGDITKSFAENLIETFGDFEETRKHLWRIRITPDTEDRNEILEKLKDMNISNEALFPGLDGFAKSVGEGLAYPRKLENT